MPVEVTASLRRALRGYEESFGCLIVASADLGLDGEPVGDVVRRAVDATNARLGRELSAQRLLVVDTPKGPGVVVFHVDRDRASEAIAALAEQLPLHGVTSAVLDRLPSVRTPGKTGWTSRLTKSWFALRGSVPDGWLGSSSMGGWLDLHPSWDVEPADLEQTVAQLTGWILTDLDPKARVTINVQDYDVPVSIASALAAMRLAVEGPRMLDMASMQIVAPDRVHVMTVNPGFGLASVSTGATHESTYDWSAELDTHIRWMREAVPWACLGAIVRINLIAAGLPTSINNVGLLAPMELGSDYYDLAQRSSNGQLNDAFGVMRMPRAMATTIGLGSPWQLEDIGNEQVLAVHRNLGAWYAADAVERDVLLDARSALGAAVADREGEQPISPIDF